MRILSTYFMIHVTDMDRAVAFYRDAFGLAQRETSPFWSELALGDQTVALHGGRTGGPVDTDLGFIVADLTEACAAVTSCGGTVVRPPEDRPGEPIRLATVADPDGNRLSLSQRR